MILATESKSNANEYIIPRVRGNSLGTGNEVQS